MNYLLSFILILLTNYSLLAQGELFYMREKYCIPKKLCLFYKYENPYHMGLDIYPKLLYYFRIPYNERMNLFPFTEYDSIAIHTPIDSFTSKDAITKNIFSDVLFNYYYPGRYYQWETYDSIDRNVLFSLKIYSKKEQKSRYIICYDTGEIETNIRDKEWNEMSMHRLKIEKTIALLRKYHQRKKDK